MRRRGGFIRSGPRRPCPPRSGCTLLTTSSTRIAEGRRCAAEMESLHRCSAFCLHALKNLASRLSLVVQNAEAHRDDPAFWKSVMLTVADTVKKMMALMSKLSLKTARQGV